MAIPTYKREQISSQVQTEKMQGAEGKAAAQGFSGISNATKGLSAQYGQRAGQEVGNLTQRLNSFSSQFDQAIKNDAVIRAKNEGIKDVASRRKEIADIQSKYYNDPKLMQEKISEVETATMQDNFSFYGRTYQNSVNTAYATQTEVDAATAANEAQAMAQKDPRKFKALYAPYRDEVVAGAPTQAGAIAAQQAFDKHGARIFSQMSMAEYAEAEAEQKQNVIQNTIGLEKLANDASLRGDQAATSAYLGQLSATIDRQVADGTMGYAEGQARKTAARVDAQGNAFMRGGTKQVSMGQGRSYLRLLQTEGTPENKMFKQLPVSKQEEILSSVKSMADNRDDSILAQKKFDAEDLATTQVETYNSILERQAEGEKFTPTQVQKLVESNAITATQAEKIISSKNVITDQSVFAHLNRTSQLINMNEEQILALDDISWEDKQTMINRMKAAKAGEYNWVTTPGGKEANKRLAADFQVEGDPLFSMPGADDPNRAAYEAKRREMYDRIQALPIEDREANALKIYNEITKEEADAEKIATEEADINRRKKQWDTAQKVVAEKNNSNWVFDYTMEDYANDTPGINKEFLERSEAEFGTTAQPKPPKPKVKVPKSQGKTTSIPNYMNPTPQRTADITGYVPPITGKNVNLDGVQDRVKLAAYPILKKYGLGVKDGYRVTKGTGAEHSKHLDGNALDITWAGRSQSEKVAIIRDLKAAGFKGFGIGETTIHTDMRDNPASWSYINGTPTGGGYMPRWAAQALRG